MKLSTIHSYAVIGVEAQQVLIEVHIANGLPGLSIVGLPETAVRESKDRVRSAILNSGFEYPARRITVNLAPADLPKSGSGFDLPIALGILLASEQFKADDLHEYSFAGELSLSGELRPINGTLPMGLFNKNRKMILPQGNLAELRLLHNQNIFCASTLTEVCAHLSKEQRLSPVKLLRENSPNINIDCLADVQGQPLAKRALEIAASGGHSMLMLGPPGTGKTLLASRLPGILPPLNPEQAVEVACVYSVSGIPRNNNQPPFRAPHHTASPVALVGGGSVPTPGEISLAHRGVLFLDELPEFSSKVLEVLRQPIESGEICISRAAGKTNFPSKFQLIAAMNPCPCGYFGEARCQCSPERIARYQSRISGPLLDRIDLQLRLARNHLQAVHKKDTAETSEIIRARVKTTQERQLERQNCLNAYLSTSKTQILLTENKQLHQLAQKSLDRMQLSMRALHRALRVALTIADMAQTPIAKEHLLEALNYRLDSS